MTKSRRFQVELEVEFDEPEDGQEQGDCTLDDVQSALDYSSAGEALSAALGGCARLNAQGQYRYTLNGEPVDLDAFLGREPFRRRRTGRGWAGRADPRRDRFSRSWAFVSWQSRMVHPLSA